MHIEISGITGTNIILLFVGFALFLVLLLMLVPRPRSTRGQARKSLFNFIERWR